MSYLSAKDKNSVTLHRNLIYYLNFLSELNIKSPEPNKIKQIVVAFLKLRHIYKVHIMQGAVDDDTQNLSNLFSAEHP